MKHTCAIVLWTVLVFGTSVSQAQPLSQGTIHFSTQQYAVSEAAPMATITVNLDRRDGGEAVVAVQCYTINGTATEEDYEPVNTAVAFAPPLAFAPGETSKTFTVPILDDILVEGNETLTLVLTNATPGATFPGGLSSAAATLVIVDNDFSPGQLDFSASSYTRSEGDGNASITVIRTGGRTGVISVNYHTVNETATAGQDYQATSGMLVLADGQTNKTFVVPIVNDMLVEPNETVSLVMTNATGGATFPDGQPSVTATLTIEDNDGPAVAAPAIVGLMREDSLLRFRFTGEPSYDYFVEFCESLSEANWLCLTNYRAKIQPLEAIVTDSLTNGAARFYRIRKQDCQCD